MYYERGLLTGRKTLAPRLEESEATKNASLKNQAWQGTGVATTRTPHREAKLSHHVSEVLQLELHQARLQAFRVPELDRVSIGLELVPP